MTKNNGLSYKLDSNSKALNCRCLRSKAYASSEVLVEYNLLKPHKQAMAEVVPM